ncbi:hypothetical protein [Flavobacterium pallidum]|uniref:Uncharacterized protein n=1 Tax=Flavobacterium pallidum TaxID=2172098 RepID=A0A2S1SIX9_9FLAO|nr:hypothetical protein [Flavobacterium pallidum]AWI26374.1 hypothetical protein HYN49_10940 [Flavobacterium pallidum]
MNKLCYAFFIFFSSIAFAQEEAPDISSDVEEEAIIEFTDGTQLEGYAIIQHKGWGEQHDMIKFRLTSDGKADLWDETMCTGVFIKHEGIQHEYKYVTMARFDLHPRLLKVFSEGSVMLYGDVTIDDRTFSMKPKILEKTARNGNTRSEKGDYGYTEGVTFYLKSERDAYPVKLWSLLSWKKKAKDYFKDCPELIEKIESKEFTSKNIPEMVDFYNNTCGE